MNGFLARPVPPERRAESWLELNEFASTRVPRRRLVRNRNDWSDFAPSGQHFLKEQICDWVRHIFGMCELASTLTRSDIGSVLYPDRSGWGRVP